MQKAVNHPSVRPSARRRDRWKQWGQYFTHPGYLIWVILAYLPFLGRMSVPLTGDQKVYLSTALEMRETGHWLSPVLFGEPSYYKPPIQYWATLIGWDLFGFNLWGALIPSLICVVLTAYFLGEIGLMLGISRRLLNSGIWFAITLGAIVFGTTAQMEIYLCLFYSAAWWAALKFLKNKRGHRNSRWLYLAFALAGLLGLVKSPLYSVFWVLSFWSYLLLAGEWELFRDRRIYKGLALGIACASSWFVAILLVDGKRFWDFYILKETIGKGSGNNSTALSLWWALLYYSFPIAMLLFPAVRTTWARRRSGNTLALIVCWSWPAAVFFTLYPYRIKNYLFILVPMVALMVDWGFFRGGRSQTFRAFLNGTAFLTALILGIAAWILAKLGLVSGGLAFALLLSGLLPLFFAFRGTLRSYALSGLVIVFFFRAAAVSIGEKDLLGLQEAQAAFPQSPFGMLDEHKNIWHEIGMLSVGIRRPMKRLESLDDVVTFMRQGGRVILDDDQYRDSMRTIEAKLLGMGDQRPLTVSPWKRWKKRSGLPLKSWLDGGQVVTDEMRERMSRTYQIIAVDLTTSD